MGRSIGSCVLLHHNDRRVLRLAMSRPAFSLFAQHYLAALLNDYENEDDEPEEVTKLLVTIVPSIEAHILEGFAIKPSSHQIPGIYEYPPAFHTTIIVTSELPRNPLTIWLRLLGRGPTQRDAIDDLMALPVSHPQRAVVLQQLQDWYQLLLKGEMGGESAALMKSLLNLMKP
jgi:hypothetical protein